jgi:hypothetical protein
MHPVVNIDEQIGKTVGRRKAGDPLVVAPGDRARKREMQRAGFFPRFPRGVYRFKTFEEADAWMIKAMTAGRLRS